MAATYESLEIQGFSTFAKKIFEKIKNKLDTKVDKVTGKGLSTNDYTTTEKNKLSGIAIGAEVNVQSDWSVTDTSSDAFIKNKPTIPTVPSATTTTPKMNGTAAVGTETKWAKGDHVHPSDTSKVNKSGDTITGTLILSRTTDASGTADNKPALIIGASSTAEHIEIDPNEILAKSNGTTPSTLYLQSDGGNVTVGLNKNVTMNVKGTLQENGKQVLTSHKTYYGTCSTAAATAAKVVTVDDTSFALTVGVMVTVKFTNTNTASNPTINVNNTGAKSVWYNTAVITTGSLTAAGKATMVTTYVYDGTNWVWVSQGIDNNTTYSAMSAEELNTGTATTARSITAKVLGDKFATKQDTLTAGSNITISGNTISATNTNNAVTQTISSTTNADYRVLMSATADDTTRTEGARKDTDFKYNPSTNKLTVGNITTTSPQAQAIVEDLTGLATPLTAGQNLNVFKISAKNADGTITYEYYPIGIIGNNGTDGYNSGIRLGSHNGTTIVGAGESSISFAAARKLYNNENLYLTADGHIEAYVGGSKDASSYVSKYVFGTSTNFHLESPEGYETRPPVIYQDYKTVDMTAADNNVTETRYVIPSIQRDKNYKTFGRTELGVHENGSLSWATYLRQYDTKGNALTLKFGLRYVLDKNNNLTYQVGDAAAFRRAIGAGTSSLAIGTTATTAAAGNHTHSGYMSSDPQFIEMRGSQLHYIDMHFGGSTADYTARIIEGSAGTLTAFNKIVNSSDRRLKTDIINIPEGYIELLNKIEPKQYKFKKGNEKRNLGFIAQEILDSLNELNLENALVEEPEDIEKDYYSLDYNAMTAILWKGWQYQQQQIEELQNEIKLLKEQI